MSKFINIELKSEQELEFDIELELKSELESDSEKLYFFYSWLCYVLNTFIYINIFLFV